MVKMRKDKKFSSFKHPIPNIFQGTAFKKHTKLLIEKKKELQIHRIYFSSCFPLRVAKKKLTIFLTMFIFIQLIVYMKIFVIIL